ncbi:MAG: N-acetyl-gamma-glutamyl-phosphate reductase, partial [Nanoarchaeota archaeon]|nr:N-acetyl-gamma-glutamyl-phosphate reductase [Nanoarchaeota archaeon]
MTRIRASIIGASGYVGGESLRLLLSHPEVEVVQATSESNVGKFIHQVHPNLRKKTMLKFSSINALEEVDVMFLGLPHGVSSNKMEYLMSKTKKIIDKGSDFRLHNEGAYERWYGHPHPRKDLLEKFVYGLPEINREKIRNASYVAAAGCNATATILGLYPFVKAGIIEPERTIVEVKNGSSEGGNKSTEGSHHPERNDCLRSYMPTGHRHMAEVTEYLDVPYFGFSATSVGLVRGILMTSHLSLKRKFEDKEIWKLLREVYGNEPFIRFVKEKQGIYRYPEPKILWGTNYCDIGFELDENMQRLVVITALDNLMKGAAGQAVQCMNIMFGLDETAGLE